MAESGETPDGWRDWPDCEEHVVFILGAGFSRAISDKMPLTDELGLAALSELRGTLPPRLALDSFPPNMNFESWLSQLASDQPYLSDAENAENRAAFMRLSDSIASVLGQRVDSVLAENYPEWLLQFVSAAHHARSTLITFNYDTLIECFVDTPTGILGNHSRDVDVWDPIHWTELSGGLPPWPPGDAYIAATQVETLMLLKMHGSLNWYWRPRDRSGISVARRKLPGHFGSPQAYEDEERRRRLPGRVPYVVPPASSKSDYYADPIASEMWAPAARRLRRAKRVVLVGYSLPATDTTFSNMLRESIQGSDCDVLIADLDPGPVFDRLLDLGIAQERILVGPSGAEAVPSLVHSWIDSLGRSALMKLLNYRGPTRQLVLAWGDGTAYAPISDLEKNADGVLVHAERIYSSFALATGINSRATVSRSEGLSKCNLDGETALALKAAHPRLGRTQPVITVLEHSTNTVGGEEQLWLVLQVAATPPAADPSSQT